MVTAHLRVLARGPMLLGAVALTFATDGYSASAHRVRQCEYRYQLAGHELNPTSTTPGCGAALSLVTGDVAAIAAPQAAAPRTKITANCRREETERYRCWGVLKCSRQKTITTPATRTIDAPFEYSVFFERKKVGAVTAGTKRVLVAPKDGALALTPIPVAAHVTSVTEQISTLCASNERREDQTTEYWFDKQQPRLTVTHCRPGTPNQPSDCPEIAP